MTAIWVGLLAAGAVGAPCRYLLDGLVQRSRTRLGSTVTDDPVKGAWGAGGEVTAYVVGSTSSGVPCCRCDDPGGSTNATGRPPRPRQEGDDRALRPSRSCRGDVAAQPATGRARRPARGSDLSQRVSPARTAPSDDGLALSPRAGHLTDASLDVRPPVDEGSSRSASRHALIASSPTTRTAEQLRPCEVQRRPSSQLGVGADGVEHLQPGSGPLCHGHRHRPVGLHDRCRLVADELAIEAGDLSPVRGVGGGRSGMAGGGPSSPRAAAASLSGRRLVRPSPCPAVALSGRRASRRRRPGPCAAPRPRATPLGWRAARPPAID